MHEAYRMAVLTRRIVLMFTAAALLGACGARTPPAPARSDVTGAVSACTAPADAFLRARLRGAIEADLAWGAADLQCEGGVRPDGSGIRVSLAGPLNASGQRVRLVFGMAVPPGAASNRAVPTNVTLILEGANRVYATLGPDKCSVDALQQQPAGTSGAAGDYWVSARGFCVEPASTLDGSERVLLSRFDFRGRIHVDDADLHGRANST